jgi:hypothetical protein
MVEFSIARMAESIWCLLLPRRMKCVHRPTIYFAVTLCQARSSRTRPSKSFRQRNLFIQSPAAPHSQLRVLVVRERLKGALTFAGGVSSRVVFSGETNACRRWLCPHRGDERLDAKMFMTRVRL